ncbi:hypothetical protein PilKf_00671 [Pillotina sp. SPG140]|jgi:hypothetical protein
MEDLFSGGTIESNTKRLHVVRAEFKEALSLSLDELFDGFDRLRAITYSSGTEFMIKILDKFAQAEVVFGFEGVLSYEMHEILAYQSEAAKRIKSAVSQTTFNLRARMEQGSVHLFVARKQLSHEKTYLLESKDGRKRVITGSANMSSAAFSGYQRENIIIMDGDEAFCYYYERFEDLKAHSVDSIAVQAIFSAADENSLDCVPLFHTVRAKTVVLIEPARETIAETRFILSVTERLKDLKPLMPVPNKDGATRLTADKIIKIKQDTAKTLEVRRELQGEYPHLVVDIFNRMAFLQHATLNTHPPQADIKRDVELFLSYMDGFKQFYGDYKALQAQYFKFAVWVFASPFLASIRQKAHQAGRDNFTKYPMFGILYGQSKAGKTHFLETLLLMMIGQKQITDKKDFTPTAIDKLRRAVEGVPLIIDDLDKERFDRNAGGIIKTDYFGTDEPLINYPAVIISANEDIKALSPEYTRRSVVCRVEGGITTIEAAESSVVERVQKRIGTALYREYLGRMLDGMPDFFAQLESKDAVLYPDILATSSQILCTLITECGDGSQPHWVRDLTFKDYFSEKVIGAYARETIRTAWRIDKKSFKIDVAIGKLSYNAKENHEAKYLRKELPEYLEIKVGHGGWLTMNLEKACEFFNIDFSKRGIFSLIKRAIVS